MEKFTNKNFTKKNKIVWIVPVLLQTERLDIQRDRWTDRHGEINRRYLTIIHSNGATTD
jgi:hypothetical protein